MARLLAVSTSGYYKRAKRSVTTALTDGQPRKAELTVKIIADLRAAGEQISEKTVAQIMSEIGLAGISPRTFKGAHHHRRSHRLVPGDLVERRFDQGRPDAVWSSDITYLTSPTNNHEEERTEVADWLTEHNWDITAVTAEDLMANNGRYAATDLDVPTPQSVFVEGRLN